MADQIDGYQNISITLLPEGLATITCGNCMQTVPAGGDATVNYVLRNNNNQEDWLFAELWSNNCTGSGAGSGCGSKDQDLFRGLVPANTDVPLSIIFQNVTGPINKSIRVGHFVGEVNYENLTLYEGYPTSDPLISITPDAVSFTGMPRSNTTYLRKTQSYGDFDTRFKINLANIDPAAPTVEGGYTSIAFTRNASSTTHEQMRYSTGHDGICLYAYCYTTDAGYPQYAIYILDCTKERIWGVNEHIVYDGWLFCDMAPGQPCPYPFPTTLWVHFYRVNNGTTYYADIYNNEADMIAGNTNYVKRLQFTPAVPDTAPFNYFLPLCPYGAGSSTMTITGSIANILFS